MSKLVIFDRDGTLVKAMPRGEYLLRLSQLEILPGAWEVLQAAHTHGYEVAVATNQPQIGKELLDQKTLEVIHAVMQDRLDWMIDRIFVCPHANYEAGCLCRKPRPGMLIEAMNAFRATPQETIMIGDTDKDVKAGQAVRCRTIFIVDDQNEKELANCEPDHVVHSLHEIIPLL